VKLAFNGENVVMKLNYKIGKPRIKYWSDMEGVREQQFEAALGDPQFFEVLGGKLTTILRTMQTKGDHEPLQ
jgi:hypothetical protein